MAHSSGFFYDLAGSFQNEQPPNQSLQQDILSTIKSLHISCGVDMKGPVMAKSNDDFIGICILHANGDKVLQDSKGRRVKSGYILTTSRADLKTPKDVKGTDTLHRQAYSKIFGDLETLPGVVIVGFSQHHKVLKGSSATFNSNNCTNSLPGRKGCLFSYRSLIFGAIILHKLTGPRDISPSSACFCLCLFLIVKNHGDDEDMANFPVANLELEGQHVFLEEMLKSFKIEKSILDAVCVVRTPGLRSRSTEMKISASKIAMKGLTDGIKANFSKEEFKLFVKKLVETFSKDGGGRGPSSAMGAVVLYLEDAYAEEERELLVERMERLRMRSPAEKLRNYAHNY